MARKTKKQAEETRLHIMETALRLFSEHGVSATSLCDIAVAAGVTRGAIYWHFRNKTELFNEIWARLETKMTDFETEYHAKFPDDPLHVMRELLIYMLKQIECDGEWRSMMEIIFHKCEFIGEIRSSCHGRKAIHLDCYNKVDILLNGCILSGKLPGNTDARRAAIALRAYLSGVMENWLFMPESFELSTEAPFLVDGLIDMLRFSPAMRQAR
ncbi:multidrug efflux transporter transcriptional repressor AcrR [Lonsdalea populi]|uniref:multidrug efflux transporter transcriptional repressor AcrR n=1 Tax=Lonsdalea populi TaxID=1172565 RepID=UPI000A257902|nr:multidrug efflux transporter transcriptional repressor AcrR [Lonsdalea populi]OSM98024.1 transcriptional regulator [Lonsdalea populi]RAT70104.1 transcriptional regulator [Lonsdalea populi]RAT73581.1 transcriptional regulator [Lonsdalea populi]RAT77274.1 transcriptional regulator [Lonsdalea populi]RAT78230.1 transcriptional regulator [Lonsdalea populi]